MRGSFGGVVLIVIGVFALGRNLGWFDVSLIELIGTWWPLLLIGLGVSLIFAPNGNKRSKQP